MSETDEISTRAKQAERLKRARISAGFAVATDAAAALGVNDRTYAGHENGARGYRKHAALYAEKFNTTVDWLLFGNQDTANSQGQPQQNDAIGNALSKLLVAKQDDLYNSDLVEYSFRKAMEFDNDVLGGNGSIESVLDIAKHVYKLASTKNKKE